MRSIEEAIERLVQLQASDLLLSCGSPPRIRKDGRLELLEYKIEDRSDPEGQGIKRARGMYTMVFTGARRDWNFHGCLELSGIGRAKFTDGTLVAVRGIGPVGTVDR